MLDPSSQTALHSLAAYPRWLVVVCAAVAAVFLLWLAGRLLTWAFKAIPVTLVVVGGVAVVWWLLK